MTPSNDTSAASEAASPPRPFDLLTETADRLALVCVLFMVAFFLAWLAAPPFDSAFPILDVALVVALSCSVLVLVASRKLRDQPRRLADIAIAFQVIVCLDIAVVEHWAPWTDAATVRGVSWICVVLVVFPMTMNASPRRTLAGSLAAAAMAPIGLALTSIRGNPWPNVEILTAVFLPVFMCAGIAYVLARILDQAGRETDEEQRMGSYRLIEPLGKGGMGEVWRAEHAMLGRPAAVKFVLPEVVSVQLGEEPYTVFRRFEREARATAHLSSPHTISLFDFGYAKSGAFYYVMELLDGVDLETLVARFGPLPAERATFLLRQVCSSLAEAHEAGLVHRDIKPANIYVCRLGIDHDFVKVLDFGLVVSSESAKEQLTRLTNEGLTSGTPAYMAPETATGAELDARADLYGLGCVAYWLLTGRQVFESKSPMRVLADHVQAQPKPPSQRTELPIPEDLEQLVLKCLEKHPDHRPQTAAELGAALDELEFAERWSPTRAQKWWRLNLPGVVRGEG